MPRRWFCLAAALLIAAPVVILAGGSSGQEPATSADSSTRVKKTPVPYTRPSSGQNMYIAYCASCHGKDGKGNGPAASALKFAPADLTQLTARHGGQFPEKYVIQTIKGDSAASGHGSKEMPVWGPIFGAMGTASDGMSQLRIRNLTKYLASLQQK